MSITSSRMFIIHGDNNFTLDLTQNIVVPTYKVSRQPVYEEWQDSNWTTHRDVVKKAAEGTFTLKFMDVLDYEAFENAIESYTETDGSINVDLYLNKTRELVNTNVFIEYDPVDNLPFYGVKDYDGIEITIKEREGVINA